MDIGAAITTTAIFLSPRFMLNNFIKKKQERKTKIMNIDKIQAVLNQKKSCATRQSEEITSSDASSSVQEKEAASRNVYENADRLVCSTSVGATDLTGADPINDNLVTDNTVPKPENTGEQASSVRKEAVLSRIPINIKIPYSLYSCNILLPKSYKRLSTLYKIISTIHTFNKKRDMSLIFSKYKDSIERLFKDTVHISDLERINFLLKGAILFTPVTIMEKDAVVESFTIKILGEIDVDQILFKHYIYEYERWLKEMSISGRIIRVHPDFRAGDVPLLSFTGKLEDKAKEPLRTIAKSKAASIYERVRERERQRKEAFVRMETKKVDVRGKVESVFAIRQRKALKLNELFQMIGCTKKEEINELLEGDYYVKIVEGCEYLVKR